MTPQTTQDTPTEANDGIQVRKLYWKSCLPFTLRLFSHHNGLLLRRRDNYTGWGFCSQTRTVILAPFL